jgi:hypothetical protein
MVNPVRKRDLLEKRRAQIRHHQDLPRAALHRDRLQVPLAVGPHLQDRRQVAVLKAEKKNTKERQGNSM